MKFYDHDLGEFTRLYRGDQVRFSQRHERVLFMRGIRELELIEKDGLNLEELFNKPLEEAVATISEKCDVELQPFRTRTMGQSESPVYNVTSPKKPADR